MTRFLDRTDRTGPKAEKPEQDSITGQAEQDRQNRKGKQDRQNRTDRTGQADLDRGKSAGRRTEQQTGLMEQDWHNKTASTGLPGQDY
jgi:hypothetical protein